MNKKELQKILELHQKWLNGEDGGECADLISANLSGANLSYANLSYADLSGAFLSYADLRFANLSGADLSYADLRFANLRSANLSNANLSNANLRFANLRSANLSNANLSYAFLSCVDLSNANLGGANLAGADLTGVLYDERTAFFSSICPEKDSFIGYKKCRNDLIVELKIPVKAKRSSATTRKCRCSEAKVIAIYDLENNKVDVNYAISSYDFDFKYKVGETVKVDDFDENRWNECSTGIHFFLTFDEARRYNV